MTGIITKIEPDRRLRIPEELGEEFMPEQEVELVRCEEGILVKPLGKTPLEVALQRKVMMYLLNKSGEIRETVRQTSYFSMG